MDHIKAWNRESGNWKGGHYTLDILERMGPRCSRGRLLDAGCGSGKYALPLAMREFDVVAVDVSRGVLKTAKERGMGRKLDIAFLAANIYQVPFRDASFDVIWCYGVLQHLLLKERRSAVDEFRRLLKKGGTLFIEVMGKDDMRYGGSEIEHNTFSRKNGIIYHYFNKTEIGELLDGFEHDIFESRKEKKFNGEYYTRHMISAAAIKL